MKVHGFWSIRLLFEQLLAALDASATRLNAIADLDQKIARIGVVDCMVTDPNNPLLWVMRQMRELMPDAKIQIGIYDFLACIEELQSDRLDIAIVGIAGNEELPNAVEAIPLYQEVSSLYCSPDHPCASIDDPDALKQELVRSEISAHSFVFNPIDSEFDPKLLDHSGGVAQDNIELSAYLALSGSHIGCLPDHYAQPWVETGELVSLGAHGPSITSDFHAVRSRIVECGPHLNQIWDLLSLVSSGSK